ncbi:MAG: lysine transporter LysE [Chloroflexi bacterium HGW-Chloroflexi-4]|nr:MAG: lysine transporter LysE [Chloroflexi bacterium HGW-Chloroflexi-4]
MNIQYLLNGLIIGFSIAAPVGPIGVLCIRRTLADGRAAGLLSGLGAATADALYGCVAGFGMTLISSFLVSQQNWIQLIGGAFLCYLGAKTLLIQPAREPVAIKKKGLLGSYASTFFLTLTNPMTIFSFAAIFAGLGLASTSNDLSSAAILVFGVFCGSAAWWLLLSGMVGSFREKFGFKAMQWVNRISGIIILGFGIYALLSLIQK